MPHPPCTVMRVQHTCISRASDCSMPHIWFCGVKGDNGIMMAKCTSYVDAHSPYRRHLTKYSTVVQHIPKGFPNRWKRAYPQTQGRGPWISTCSASILWLTDVYPDHRRMCRPLVLIGSCVPAWSSFTTATGISFTHLPGHSLFLDSRALRCQVLLYLTM